MLENIWRGLQIDYTYLMEHCAQAAFILIIAVLILVLGIYQHIRLHHSKLLTELFEQQQYIERVQLRLNRMTRTCVEIRDKQRLISNPLQRLDNSIFELEEAVVNFKDKVNAFSYNICDLEK